MDENSTEAPSRYDGLEKMSVQELLTNINKEDQTVPHAVQKAIPVLSEFVEKAAERMLAGGRLFYIGSGTSGRLGILDASECPPTYGVSHDLVTGLIAGGDAAIRKAVEFAEDDEEQGWEDLKQYTISDKDTLVGIAASGKTPYVTGAVKEARERGILTACITCNSGTELAASVDYPVEVIVGPEFVTGSTRMKAGTAQKMVLNMISTSLMIKLGHVKGNRMIDMQLTNKKLVKRGIKMLMEDLLLSEKEAEHLLFKHGSVREAIAHFKKGS